MAREVFSTTTGDQREAPRARVGLRWLEVVHGAECATRMMLGDAPVCIGRTDAGNALGLDDAGVSRRHAEVRWDASSGSVELVDCNSRNGTFVDGVRTERVQLTRGAVVRVGGTLLIYDEASFFDDEAFDPPNGILEGSSLAIQRVRAEIRRFAPHPLPALVLGESGVGKELAAVEIHRQSRRPGPLVSVNCAAIARSLAESELFGHAPGAFTGAIKKHDGFFAAADHGTLFLDEIGEMPLELQAKLLRAIAAREIRPVGSMKPEQVDVRIVAATNRDLEQAVAEGSFRGDLLARLQAFTLHIPPLRERKDDVLVLVRRLLKARGVDRVSLTSDAAEALLLHPWPYNVRELEQVITVASVRAEGGPIRVSHLPRALAERLASRIPNEAPATGAPASVPLGALVNRERTPTRDELEQVLVRLDGNMAEAAAFFGKDRRQVYRWAERLGLDPERFRKADGEKA